MPFPLKSRRTRPDESQLALPLAWLGEDAFIRALKARGVDGVLRIRFRPNRTRLISLSADGHSLNLHECFRGSPDNVIDAIATFLSARNGSREQRVAVRVMRAWSEGQVADDAGAPPRVRVTAGTSAQQRFLADIYRLLNLHLFDSRLPDGVPLRLSNRMARRFGHVEYRRVKGAGREIAELALNLDLLIEGNERHLLDTLLHEMAHVEAWVVHGHRGHGAVWRQIARRVGCEVRALSWVRIRRRRGTEPGHVPEIDRLLSMARRHASPGARREPGWPAPAPGREAGSRIARAG